MSLALSFSSMAVWPKSSLRYSMSLQSRKRRKVRKAMPKLQDRLDEFKKTFSSGIEDAALKVGDRAPSFTLFWKATISVSR
jgi:phage-related protein